MLDRRRFPRRKRRKVPSVGVGLFWEERLDIERSIESYDVYETLLPNLVKQLLICDIGQYRVMNAGRVSIATRSRYSRQSVVRAVRTLRIVCRATAVAEQE